MKLPSLPASVDLGLLLVRLMLGVVGVFHGSQKLFGAFGGHGMQGFIGFLEGLKVPAPQVSAYLAALAEFAGGILIAVGLFPRLAAIPYAFAMFVAAFMVHGKEFDSQKGGMEYPLTLGVMALAIVFAGGGRLAITGPRAGAPRRPAPDRA
jgi:putative oxidoreductase